MAKLQELDQDFYNSNGTLTKKGGLMSLPVLNFLKMPAKNFRF
jgi:hypothetical protein